MSKHNKPFLPLMTPLAASCVALFSAWGCGPDSTSSTEDMGGQGVVDMRDTIRCTANEILDPQTGMCVPFFPDLGMPDSGDDLDMGPSGDMTPDPDLAEEMGEEMDLGPDPECVDTTVYLDGDGDGVGVDNAQTNKVVCLTFDEEYPNYARIAGDCDDNNIRRSPAQPEVCDEVDNDCDGNLNQGIICEFFAHSPDQVYRIDPFKLTLSVEGVIDTPKPLLDIDTHPDGRLYGISADKLYHYRYNGNGDYWEWADVGSLQQSLQGANGLAIDRSGKAYATARNELYEINLTTGQATAPTVLSGMVNSSGDCVINKGDTLFMTSKDSNSMRNDELVRIDRTTSTTTVIGLTSHRNIFGLTAAWGKLFGVTRDGELIAIDQGTGESRLLKQFNNVSFYGAASTPSR